MNAIIDRSLPGITQYSTSSRSTANRKVAEVHFGIELKKITEVFNISQSSKHSINELLRFVVENTDWDGVVRYGLSYDAEDEEFNLIVDRDIPYKSLSIKLVKNSIRVTRITNIAKTEKFAEGYKVDQIGGAINWLNSPLTVI